MSRLLELCDNIAEDVCTKDWWETKDGYDTDIRTNAGICVDRHRFALSLLNVDVLACSCSSLVIMIGGRDGD